MLVFLDFVNLVGLIFWSAVVMDDANTPTKL
jgi:hypothetical protein